MLHATMMAAVVLANAAPAETPLELQRVGKWQIEDDGEACHLSAQFGEGANSIVMRITRYTLDENFEFRLLGQPVVNPAPTAEVKLDFGIGKPSTRTATFLKAENGSLLTANSLRLDGWEHPPGTRPGAVAPNVGAELEGKSTAVTITMQRHTPLRLVTGSMEKPMAALRKCTDDLTHHWGYDPSALHNLKRYPTLLVSRGALLSSADYPATMLRADVKSDVQFRLGVDETGGVSSCHILYQDPKAPFAEATCIGLRKRAKFSPALGPDGKPVPIYFVSRAYWR